MRIHTARPTSAPSPASPGMWLHAAFLVAWCTAPATAATGSTRTAVPRVTSTFQSAATATPAWLPPLVLVRPDNDTSDSEPGDLRLFRRADTCPAGYYSCTDQGSAFAGVCCTYSQVCALDDADRAACCPAGDVCTGTVSAAAAATSTYSYVANTLYPYFPYIASSGIVVTAAFADTNACNAAVEFCSANYVLCTSLLEGAAAATTTAAPATSTTAKGTTRTTTTTVATTTPTGSVYIVTIVVSGETTLTKGGVANVAAATTAVAAAAAAVDAVSLTVSTTLVASSAASLCSSLSSIGCAGLPTSGTAGCTSLFGAATGAATNSANFVAGSSAIRGAMSPALFEKALLFSAAAGAVVAGVAAVLL